MNNPTTSSPATLAGMLRTVTQALSALLSRQVVLGGESMTLLQAVSVVCTTLLLLAAVVVAETSITATLFIVAVTLVVARPLMGGDNEEGGDL